jgi:electron transport complex protein RnfB
MHDLCKNCNECAIAVACPSRAYDRIPRETPYRVKKQALALIRQKASDPANVSARALLQQVYQP